MDSVQQEVDRVYKKHFGKLVSSLLYSSRDINPELAEDIVHDSFSAALINWRSNGIPLNTAGWIYKVCKNKAINALKSAKPVQELNETDSVTDIELKFSESFIDDHQLKLLFACAHPDLSPKIQVVITLKYVANLKVEPIAKVLGMTIDGVDKLLLRARQKIKDEKILLEEPHHSALRPRLESVHKILYLIFNEGYKSSWGKEMIREDLCEEALLMTKSLLESPLGAGDTAALYALMLFNSARFPSRFDMSGALLDLENQDRSKWNKDLIALATQYLHQSRTEIISSYHLEASIAFIHCTAAHFGDTDWETITQLYRQLLKDNPNPFAELSYAIALYYAGRKQQAFEILQSLERHPFLNQYSLLNATLGKFHHAEGNDALAKQYLQKALQQTTFDDEKNFINKMIRRIDEQHPS